MFALFKLSGLALVALFMSVSGIVWGIGWAVWYFFLGGRVLEEHETRRRADEIDQMLADMRGTRRGAPSSPSPWVRPARLIQLGLPIVLLVVGIYLLASN